MDPIILEKRRAYWKIKNAIKPNKLDEQRLINWMTANVTAKVSPGGEPFLCLSDEEAAWFMGVGLNEVVSTRRTKKNVIHRIVGEEKVFRIIWLSGEGSFAMQ